MCSGAKRAVSVRVERNTQHKRNGGGCQELVQKFVYVYAPLRGPPLCGGRKALGGPSSAGRGGCEEAQDEKLAGHWHTKQSP